MAKPSGSYEQYESLGGTSRRYRNLETGDTISRRQYLALRSEQGGHAEYKTALYENAYNKFAEKFGISKSEAARTRHFAPTIRSGVQDWNDWTKQKSKTAGYGTGQSACA